MDRFCQQFGPGFGSARRTLAIFGLVIFTSTAGHAEADLTVAPKDNSHTELIPARAFFSEQAVVIDMVLSGTQWCPKIVATLVQKTARLEAEIAQQRLVDCDQPRPPFDDTAQPIAFQFAVPAIKRESRFEWRFAECDTAGGNCRALMEIPFDAFPLGTLAPIRKWASRESLVVKDPAGALSNFFDQQDIEYINRRSGIAKGSRVISLLVEDKRKIDPERLAPYLERGGVVVFRKSPATLPLIKSRRVAGQALISVELPLIAALGTNPRAQKALLEIFQMLFERADNI